MNKFLSTIYNIIAWIIFVVGAIILMIIALFIFVIAYPFDPKRKAIHIFSGYWGLHYFWINPLWKIKFKCDEQINKNQSYVIVSNHQSMFDICLMYKIHLIFKWISKEEVLKMPFVGWLLRMHGDIMIKRGDNNSTKNMLRQAQDWIKKGCSISIFPEGTRSVTGKMRPFKEGAFMVAKLNKVPIIPVVIEGTRDMLPAKGGRFGGKATAQIHVLPIISAETVASMKLKDLSDMLHAMMVAEHKKMAPDKYLND